MKFIFDHVKGVISRLTGIACTFFFYFQAERISVCRFCSQVVILTIFLLNFFNFTFGK